MLEAKCTACGEIFVPHTEEPEDLVHFWSEERGQECGGAGEVIGEWILDGFVPRDGHDTTTHKEN